MREIQHFHFYVPPDYIIGGIEKTPEGWWHARGDVLHGRWIREHRDINHDPHFVKWCADWIEEGTAVLDIGANIGTHSIPYLRRRPASLVCVEAFPTLFECLRRNLLHAGTSESYLTSVTAYCSGVGADYGLSVFHYNPESPGTSFVDNAIEGERIEIRPIEYFTEFVDEGISLIKIDVEGYEPFVIQGAKEILDPKLGSNRPVIIMEVNNVFLARHQWNSSMLFELMASLDYKELGTWPPEYDALPREELFSKPVFEKCFIPG